MSGFIVTVVLVAAHGSSTDMSFFSMKMPYGSAHVSLKRWNQSLFMIFATSMGHSMFQGIPSVREVILKDPVIF
jgi:hypothetical protein